MPLQNHRNRQRLDELTKSTAKELDIMRMKRGMTRRDLAKLVERHPSYVTSVLNAETNLTMATVVHFAECLDMNVEVKFSRKVPSPVPELMDRLVEDIPDEE
jgi:transcriptional regulator with XRE-family HTH domain